MTVVAEAAEFVADPWLLLAADSVAVVVVAADLGLVPQVRNKQKILPQHH